MSRIGVQGLDLAPAGLVLVELLALLAGGANKGDFGADLLDAGALVDFHEDLLCLLELAMVDELAWRFGTEGQHAGEGDGGNGACGSY